MAADREHYPRTLPELERRFSSDEACRAYLSQVRWPNGFRCPACGADRGWPTGRVDLIECAGCHHQTSVIAGTIFEGTRKPLPMWFRAMWLVTSEKNGVSALGLQRQLGLGSYETAWAWLHKLRRAMVRPGRDRLHGVVEVDETYVGGLEPGVRGRETAKKSLVAVDAEEDGTRIGRIRLRRIPDASGPSLEAFIAEAVEPGSILHTDGWSGYDGVEALGYAHQVSNIKRSGRPAQETMPRVHRVASLLKRWMLGTHQGSVSPEHLDYYLDEFTFRFNRRASRSRGKLFYRLVEHKRWPPTRSPPRPSSAARHPTKGDTRCGVP